MWQRVQTLYLAIATALVAAMFFCTKAVSADGALTISFISYIPYLILLIIASALQILALTTFRHRIFQMRTTILSAIILLALQIWLVVDFITTRGEVIFRLPALFPVVAVILDVMAARGILADQLLVESAYHLRKSRRERRR